MIYVVEIPGQGYPRAWFAYDKEDFARKMVTLATPEGERFVNLAHRHREICVRSSQIDSTNPLGRVRKKMRQRAKSGLELQIESTNSDLQ